jgi:Fe-S-cluster containining protein
MVDEQQIKNEVVKKVGEIYRRLDLYLAACVELAGECKRCGRCCDFESFDHRLFVTSPEMMYLAENLGTENIKPMSAGRCSYNIEGKCTIYEHRFSGCRIFCCRGDRDFQSRLSEATIKKFKAVCKSLGIDYRYTDLAAALGGFPPASPRGE